MDNESHSLFFFSIYGLEEHKETPFEFAHGYNVVGGCCFIIWFIISSSVFLFVRSLWALNVFRYVFSLPFDIPLCFYRIDDLFTRLFNCVQYSLLIFPLRMIHRLMKHAMSYNPARTTPRTPKTTNTPIRPKNLPRQPNKYINKEYIKSQAKNPPTTL